jgi:hypothetical protein
MKIYFSGNFPAMADREKEQALMDAILKVNPEYGRLVSYYFPKGMKNLLAMKEEENASKSK